LRPKPFRKRLSVKGVACMGGTFNVEKIGHMTDSASSEIKGLKRTLDRFYREYDFEGRMRNDPIEFPHRYRNAPDVEVVAFLSASFAYGRVDVFKSTIDRILSRMGASPYDFLLDLDIKKAGRSFSGISYRFNENEDILCLLFVLHSILEKDSSIETTFRKSYRRDDANIGSGLSGLVGTMLKIDTTRVYGRNIRPAGYLQFFPSPVNGSACKRANLFLRWMIRDRDIDFGIWNGIPKNKLVIPLDTHIARISRCLGFTERKSQDWKTAVEITRALKGLDPQDPLKYDFALCHHGISGICKGKTESCKSCVFKARNRSPKR
jgi:uncharacterized protein (TIGR02757 family)